MFQEAKWDGVTETYFNPQSGWGEADLALESVIRAAVEKHIMCDFLECQFSLWIRLKPVPECKPKMAPS